MQGYQEISHAILSTAEQRGPEKSTCPSEIARQLYPDDWREQMENVRKVAIGLHKAGKVQITQGGKPVDVDHIKGPVRIKIK
ncbi:DUF3253 domain-containing protein [Pedobacter sp. SYP-B3415]|uniref:DUF3253 domain-containing protein n=1 Tax=Pedobacter sp. SYP-B3415 TaxID=2496641 RepID=UPI00101D7F4E|nr:DUF3253 domain-containing protein [Pedobacter sp. SYP-B3415]